MTQFQINSKFQPAGDQPKAIAKLDHSIAVTRCFYMITILKNILVTLIFQQGLLK